MDQILEKFTGEIGIADDIAVYGKDGQEHDQYLHNLISVARENGLIFHEDICEI